MVYGCEIWGPHMDIFMLNMPKCDLAVPCERLYIKISKQI